MSGIFIVVFCLLIIVQFTALRTTREVEEECKSKVLPSRNWKREAHLNWLRIRSWWRQRSFALNTEDAQYHFNQQEMYRQCLSEELYVGTTSNLTYFGKEFTTERDMLRSEPFCDVGKTLELKTRCQQTVDNPEFRKKVHIMFGSVNEEPECAMIMLVNLKKDENRNERIVRRTVVKCPVQIHIRHGRIEDKPSYLYISCADDPRFNGSLIYVFMAVDSKAYLEVYSLLINWQLMMS